MNLQTLLEQVSVVKTTGAVDLSVEGLTFDSRKVTPGSAFVAVKGTESDGHAFISMAIEKGARVVVYDNGDTPCDVTSVTYVLVNDSAQALAAMASAWYGHPSRSLTLVGVTGTNGKTTTATLLWQMARLSGHKAGLLSTVVNYVDDTPVASTHTTPDPITLNELLRRMVDAGCTYAFMEVSSHSVVQKRIAYLDFDGALFTNLTRDHLDYHKTFENYLKAKKEFFDTLKSSAFAITNLDDANGMIMLQDCAAKKYTYSTRRPADFKGKIIEEGFEGMQIDINGTELSVGFIGRFNVYNLLLVYGAAIALGMQSLEALRLLSLLRPVNGRFETIRNEKTGWTAIVDYAHTPDALDNVISTINSIRSSRPTRGDLITVVGCGGNRDKGKRPLMAQSAVEGSDRVIITSDNPRHEDPQDIINDMLAGLDDEQKSKTLVIVDRHEAIKTACALAKSGDVILVAGKGHEDYQIVGSEKHHFDDHEEVRRYITQ